jgi:2-succinyl-6-hydroxy-2,4-cyclohexadiene-1-carboxylate synthase
VTLRAVSALALHGFAQTPTQWASLCPTAHCPWISGHGPTPSQVPDFNAEVARLIEIARGMDAPRVLLGYSQGARLALGMLAHSPQLFERAMLVGVEPGLETDTARRERVRWEHEVAHILEVDGLEAFWTYWNALPVLAKTRVDPSSQSELARRNQLTAPGLAWAVTTLGLGSMPNFWPVLGDIPTEVDIVVGELDSKFLPVAQRAKRALQHSHLHTIAGAGHNPLFDAPEAISAWVNSMVTL